MIVGMAHNDGDSTDSGSVDPERSDEVAPLPSAATSEATPVLADSASLRTAGTGGRRIWLILAVAFAVLVAGLLLWWRASNSDDVARAETRDAVLVTATHDIEVMNSLDYRKVDQGLASWASVSTGKLKDSITQISEQEKKMLADQKKISTGKVIDSAVIDLDADSAVVIAAVEVTVKDAAAAADAEPTVKRNRFSATLARVGDAWKIEDLQQVAVNLS